MADDTQFNTDERSGQGSPRLISADQARWLREAAENARQSEEAATQTAGQRADLPLETAGFDPCEFQLVNGNNVKIVFAKFWERIRYRDRLEGARPAQYFAIKVYSTEDALPRCMAIQCEFRAGHDFSLTAVPNLWTWLGELVDDRQFVKYDSLNGFLEELAEKIAEFSDEGEDAVEHIEHLPTMTAPAEFDQVDDSMFNDQNETENG